VKKRTIIRIKGYHDHLEASFLREIKIKPLT